MSNAQLCYACAAPATKVCERTDLGSKRDRVYCCDSKACQPDADGEKWSHHRFGADDGKAMFPDGYHPKDA